MFRKSRKSQYWHLGQSPLRSPKIYRESAPGPTLFMRSPIPTISLSRMPSLSAHITRAWTGPAWHGDALAELLRDITAAEAATRPAPAVHTIAELAGHIGVWVDIARRRLSGEEVAARLTENFAPLDTANDARWRSALEQLHERHNALARTAAALRPEQLHALLPGRDHTAAQMLHGVVEHAAYHGGQIALVRNLIRAGR